MRKGFTLVELLIVIIIIGILATMAVPQYNKMVDRAKRTEAIVNLGTLATASIMYYTQYSKTSTSTGDLDATLDQTKWTYADAGGDATKFMWKATKVGSTNQIVRVTVAVPDGTKILEYTTDGTAYSAI